MKAIVLHGPNDLRFDPEYPTPSPEPGEVLLRLTYSSICQTDIEMWQHGMFSKNGPRVLGHEAAGVVEELGEGVTGIEVGTRVAVENVRTCGTCFFCRKGTAQLCENGRNFGFSDDGGLAEYGVWPASLVIPLPDNMTNEEAPLAEPTSVAVHAVENANIVVGEIAVVIGCGVVGLCTLQVLKAAGANVIAIDPRQQSLDLAKQLGAIEVLNPTEVDPGELLPRIASELRAGTYESSLLREGLREGRLQRATKSSDDARSSNEKGEISEPSHSMTSATNAQGRLRRGAESSDDERDPNAEGRLQRATKSSDDARSDNASSPGPGELEGENPEPSRPTTSATNAIGPDVIIETAGAPSTTLNAADWVRRGGRVVIVGFSHQSQDDINFGRAHQGEKTIMGSSATSHGGYQKAVDLIARGRVNVKPLISALVPLDKGIQDGFRRMLMPEKDVYRILVGDG